MNTPSLFVPALLFTFASRAFRVVGILCFAMLLGLSFGSRSALATTYYVANDGSDTNSGTSPTMAWKTLDQVNSAELKSGDTVQFKCGDSWRGSLVPQNGEENAPVTYTSFGEGPKPLLLGSVSRDRPQDWVPVQQNIWATLPMGYELGEQVLDFQKSKWSLHQEAGAEVELIQIPTSKGAMLRLTCSNSGKHSNHVQLWGPQLAVEKGTCLLMTFQAHASKPFKLQHMTIIHNGPPWNSYGVAAPVKDPIGLQWKTYKAIFNISESADSGRLHISLGGMLPEGAVFEFQPISLHLATPKISDPLTVDVGNIIFDQGKVCGWKKWSIEQLDKPYDYYYDRYSQRVFLYSKTNPTSQHTSIELALKRHVVSQGNAHHVVYDGLAVKYGAAHGFGGGNTHHLVIRNCDLSYIGGGHQTTRSNGIPVRYGNAIEFWDAAHDNLVEGCRIWEVYDAALTNQGRSSNSKQINITYRNNVIWNSEYSFEYWNHPKTALTKNIRFIHNTCVNAGKVWSHAQRPDQNGSHLMFYSNTAATSGVEIKYNIFYNVTEWGSRYSSGWKTLPEIDYNLWFSQQGIMVNWFGKKIAGFDAYRQETGFDAHSRFADPLFIDADAGNFRLKPNSPARGIRPDGGPVGAEPLWNTTPR